MERLDISTKGNRTSPPPISESFNLRSVHPTIPLGRSGKLLTVPHVAGIPGKREENTAEQGESSRCIPVHTCPTYLCHNQCCVSLNNHHHPLPFIRLPLRHQRRYQQRGKRIKECRCLPNGSINIAVSAMLTKSRVCKHRSKQRGIYHLHVLWRVKSLRPKHFHNEKEGREKKKKTECLFSLSRG